jgi:hypothetical protein
MTLHEVKVYASKDSKLVPCEIIDPDPESPCPYAGRHYVNDVALSQANIFYQDKTLKASYTRKMVSKPDHQGVDPWGGDWGNLPGARFMFGQMEGTVWPYPTNQTEDLLPRTPKNLRITSEAP